MHKFRPILLLLLAVLLVRGGDTVRPGLENIEYSMPSAEEEAFLNAVATPLMEGFDVTAAMTAWFDGRLLETQGDRKAATRKWHDAMNALKDLVRLPVDTFAPVPDAAFTKVADLRLNGAHDISLQVMSWKSGTLTQYGIVLAPKQLKEGAKYPLILYCHGAAFGIPVGFLDFLVDMVRRGYVVIAPAMRGEPLFTRDIRINGESLKCEGEIENLDGEVDDCLSMLSAAWKLPYVRPNEFAMLGHSFGSGVGLLTAARAGKYAKAVVSYDAWLVNPQRYYWDRMRRGARNWDSWEDYCNQPVRNQLTGLIKRSVIHHAESIECPLLLFMGGAYDGSVFHKSHGDFTARLRKLGKQHEYVLVPNGGHNFVLYLGSAPAAFALKKQHSFLDRHYPPLK